MRILNQPVMWVNTRVEMAWDEGAQRYEITHREGYWYEGPVARCDRGQEKKVVNQGTAQSAQDQANAQAAMTSTNAAVGDFNKNLSNFMRFGRRTYGPNGEYARTQNVLATTNAAAGATGAGGEVALDAMRTGRNTANAAPAIAEARRAASRDLTSFEANANQQRIAALSNIQQTGLDASKYPAQVYSSLYGPSVGGASSNLGVAASAAKTPGFWDTFGTSFAKGMGTALSTGGAAAGEG